MATSPSSLPLDARGKRILVENVDRISNLPDDVLLMILTSLSTEEAVKTCILSKRWGDVWKQLPFLNFDMKYTLKYDVKYLANRSDYVAQLITKVINNHYGHLLCCTIHHFSYQSRNGMLESWIQSLIHVKHTKTLVLLNLLGHRKRARVINLSPNMFSHPTLETLYMNRYDLETAHAFNGCHNLLVLKLEKICVEVGVLNTIIASCPSLKVLVLDIKWYSQIGCFKIYNNNLKLLHLACTDIDGIEVSAALLDIFSTDNFITKDNFVLTAPRLLQCSKNYWAGDGKIPHMSYNISYNAKDEENVGYGYVVSKHTDLLLRFTSLAVSVDLMNPEEVYMLQQVLVAWEGEIKDLEIFFKHNNVPKELEGESSIGGEQEKIWEKGNWFFNADFRIKVVRMYNFSGSNIEELALVFLLVTEGRVTKKLMIKTSSYPASMKLEIEAIVDKLKQLPERNKRLSIECF
ncbi:unnamed protein product [Arabis nemorensis]|uniref:F-box domain-containing protein n=1 Tax=Arabis nemorensis TaxID=586526 RepID=A0A565BCW5_9BRAS|nr:unnamed protein product [Arabis nemorensis]